DRQHLADRLDPVGVAVFVDERRHGLNRRSSSAWAKYALALRRISLACRSSRFSRSSALIRACSSLVVPGRSPWSRSARRTQLHSVCAVQPILPAIDSIAAHCEACSPRCSNTIRTARSRTSGEYVGDFFFGVSIAPSSQELEPPRIPERFTLELGVAFVPPSKPSWRARSNHSGSGDNAKCQPTEKCTLTPVFGHPVIGHPVIGHGSFSRQPGL